MAQRAVSIDPTNAEYQDTLGTVYLRNKATESALRIFEKLVERSPESARFHQHFGLAILAKGDKSGARWQFETALEKNLSPEQRKQISGDIARLGQ